MANIQSEIKDLQEAINSPATPEAQKIVMRGILAKLQSKQGSKKSTSNPPVDLSTQKGRNNYLKKPKGADDSDKDLNKRVFAYLSKKHPQYTDELLTNNKGKKLNTKALISWYPEQSIKDAYKIVAKKDTTPKGADDSDKDLDKRVFAYLGKKFPRYTDELLIKDNNGEELSDEDYNDAYFELVDDVREHFAEMNEDKGGNPDIAPDYVERYMSNPANQKYYENGKLKTKAEPKKSDTLGDYDCDELIEKEKAKAKKRKANALKKASEPKKTEATKNKERIEKVADVVETNLEKRLAKNEVSVEEIRKLIDETESLLTKLKEALKKAH
jgi:hypothetical protein